MRVSRLVDDGGEAGRVAQEVLVQALLLLHCNCRKCKFLLNQSFCFWGNISTANSFWKKKVLTTVSRDLEPRGSQVWFDCMLYLLFRIAHHVVFLFAEAHILSSLDFNSGCGIVLSSQISETRSPQQNSDKARAKVSQWLHLLQSLVAPTCEGLCLARALQPHSASSVAPDPGGGAAFTSQQWGYIFRYTTCDLSPPAMRRRKSRMTAPAAWPASSPIRSYTLSPATQHRVLKNIYLNVLPPEQKLLVTSSSPWPQWLTLSQTWR